MAMAMAAKEGAIHIEKLRRKLWKVRKDSLFLARLAQQAERYDEMTTAMENVAKSVILANLNPEERNLLTVAYRNAFTARRAVWRLACEEIEKLKESDQKNTAWMKEYRETIKSEMIQICESFVCLLNKYLLRYSSDVGAEVFYMKLKGDYLRYIVEIKAAAGEETKEAVDVALNAYKDAQTEAAVNLRRADPVRLAIDLHLAVFYVKILNSRDEAIAIAKEAHKAAKTALRSRMEGGSLSADAYTEFVQMMRKLRSNYTIWSRDDIEYSIMKNRSRYDDEFEDGDM